MVLGHRGFDVEHSECSLLGLIQSDQSKNPLKVSKKSVSDFLELLFAVIGLIGQRNSTLLEEHHIPLWVTRVVIDKELPQSTDTLALQATHHRRESIFV